MSNQSTNWQQAAVNAVAGVIVGKITKGFQERNARKHITEVFGRNVVPMEWCLAKSVSVKGSEEEEFTIDGLKFTVDFKLQHSSEGFVYYICRVVDTKMAASDPSQTRYFLWYKPASPATAGGRLRWSQLQETFVNARGK